jgi:hypothetical protein
MIRRSPHVLAIVLACLTVLAGVPPIAGSPSPDPQAGTCLASEPVAPEGVSESRGENVEEEREEDGADADLDLFGSPLVAVPVAVPSGVLITQDSWRTASFSGWCHPIRGPPAG